MKLNFAFSVLILLLLFSCNIFELKPLDVKTITDGKTTVRWFHTSDITTVHNHVEIDTKRGWVQLMESDGNAYEIYNVLINNDTVVIQAYKGMLIYELTSTYWDTHVRLDTTITLHQYMKKSSPENAKYYPE